MLTSLSTSQPLGNIWYRKSLGFSIEKNHKKNLGFVCFKHSFVKFCNSIGIGFETFPIFVDSIGFGIEKIWYQKKYRIRY